MAAGVCGPTQGDVEWREDQKFSEEGSMRGGGSEAAAGQENGIKRGLFFPFFFMIREIGSCLHVDGEDKLIRRKEHPGSYVPEQVIGAGCHTQVRGRQLG